jgi:oxalate decarboxylase/phosphoglucose isomerase-like protein (cupin superfamily)
VASDTKACLATSGIMISAPARISSRHASTMALCVPGLLMVPPGAPHSFANPGDEPAVILNTFTPDLYVQYFRDLRDMIRAGRPLSPELIGDVMARYATKPAEDPAS